MRAAIEDCVKKFLRMIKGRLCKPNDRYVFSLDRSICNTTGLDFFLNLSLITVSQSNRNSFKITLKLPNFNMFILSNFDIAFMT